MNYEAMQSAFDMGEPEYLIMHDEHLVECMKVEENHVDDLPIGFVCTLIDGMIPPGFKPLEQVEFFIISDDNPPEISFGEFLSDLKEAM